MPELILPGVYIDTRAEALIVGGPISTGNIGIVGTARQGPIGEVQILNSFGDATDIFGAYDAFDSPDAITGGGTAQPVTLVRALELAYNNGASTVYAVRVSATDASGNPTAKKASIQVQGTNVTLSAKTPGVRPITIVVADAAPNVVVTLALGRVQEIYTVTDGADLVKQVNAGSGLVDAGPVTGVTGKPTAAAVKTFAAGDNGANAKSSDYKAGFELLLNEDVQIMLAAGLDDTVIGADLKGHVESASTDKIKRDRIGILGSRAKRSNETSTAFLTAVSNPAVTSERIIYVTPGIVVTDAAKAAAGADDPTVVLPGAYAAAAIAGMLSARDPQVSLTNKTLSVSKLELKFNSGELEQLVKSGVLALEDRRGVRVVKAITTDLGAFKQITTRRIVDFARAGVRSSADPFIGLLNNDRVRKALKGAINGFLASMALAEQVTGYELDVTAKREEEIRGVAVVTMTLRPTFSIDYIQVIMFLG